MVRIPPGTSGLPGIQNVPTGPGAHAASKWPGPETKHLLPVSAKIKMSGGLPPLIHRSS